MKGFAQAAGIDQSEAEEQWAGHSRQLPDSERQTIEAGGYDSGIAEGKRFAEMYRLTGKIKSGFTIGDPRNVAIDLDEARHLIATALMLLEGHGFVLETARPLGKVQYQGRGRQKMVSPSQQRGRRMSQEKSSHVRTLLLTSCAYRSRIDERIDHEHKRSQT